MWIDDLSPYEGLPRIAAVGWLERGHEYRKGVLPPGVYEKIETLVSAPWKTMVVAGAHPCDICLYKPEQRGSRNVFVPGRDKVYVAPELILHYMNAHQYRPPDEFCEAVLACPPTSSPEYRRSVLAAGGSEFFAAVKGT